MIPAEAVTHAEAFGAGLVLGLLPLTGALLAVGICWAAAYLVIAVTALFDLVNDFARGEWRK